MAVVVVIGGGGVFRLLVFGCGGAGDGNGRHTNTATSNTMEDKQTKTPTATTATTLVERGSDLPKNPPPPGGPEGQGSSEGPQSLDNH